MSTVNSSSKAQSYGLIGLGIALLGLLIALIVFLWNRAQSKKVKAETTQAETPQGLSETEQKQIFYKIVDYMKNLGYNETVAMAIAGQSALETGRFSSELAQNYNNFFGMKAGGSGKGITTQSTKGFAVYDSFADSLTDLDQWLLAKGFNKSEDLSPENYLQWIKSKKYFEAPLAEYKNSVLSLINELNS